MKSLILIAHGSRRAQSNDEVRRLTECLRLRAADRYDRVDCAFLELAEPSIPDSIDAAVAAGSDTVVVLPYFLASGRHVVEDIPGFVEQKRAQYPRVRFVQTEILGAAPDIPALLLDLVEQADTAENVA